MGVANMQFREGPILKLGKNRVHLVLSEEELAGLDIQPGRDDDPIVIVDPLPAGAKLPASLADTASAIVLEVRPGQAASIERIADLRATRPDLPLIAAIRDADLALVKALIKQGVNDVVALPLAYGELMEALRDLPRVERTGAIGNISWQADFRNSQHRRRGRHYDCNATGLSACRPLDRIWRARRLPV